MNTFNPWGSNSNNLQSNNGGFNINGLLEFAQNLNQDPTQLLENEINSGKYTQEQINQARQQAESMLSQSNNIISLLNKLGIR